MIFFSLLQKSRKKKNIWTVADKQITMSVHLENCFSGEKNMRFMKQQHMREISPPPKMRRAKKKDSYPNLMVIGSAMIYALFVPASGEHKKRGKKDFFVTYLVFPPLSVFGIASFLSFAKKK